MTDQLHPYVPPGPLESAPRGDFHPREVRREAFAAILDGIPMGAYDHRMIAWLTDLDDPTCQAFASLMLRCRQAGPPGSVTEWGVRYTDPDGSIREIANKNEARARRWAAPDPDPWGPQVETALIQRSVGPWKEVPDA